MGSIIDNSVIILDEIINTAASVSTDVPLNVMSYVSTNVTRLRQQIFITEEYHIKKIGHITAYQCYYLLSLCKKWVWQKNIGTLTL